MSSTPSTSLHVTEAALRITRRFLGTEWPDQAYPHAGTPWWEKGPNGYRPVLPLHVEAGLAIGCRRLAEIHGWKDADTLVWTRARDGACVLIEHVRDGTNTFRLDDANVPGISATSTLAEALALTLQTLDPEL